MPIEAFSGMDKEGGRIGWGHPRTKSGGGVLGSGQGGLVRCVGRQG
ncbi:hypothetical protein ACF9IK_26840 [Kitasatospora hibisci]